MGDSQREVVTQSEVQAAILQVRSVLGCRVVITDGLVEEVHVLSSAERGPKQIARDVETILAVRFGLTLDHRKISVAQLGEEDSRERITPQITLQSIQVKSDGSSTSIEVSLACDRKVYAESKSGSTTLAGRLRLAAEVTLLALENYLGGTCHLAVDDVVPFDIGRWEGVLVAVSLWTPQGEESLVGSALIRGDAIEAAARATLDAVDRRIVVASLSAVS